MNRAASRFLACVFVSSIIGGISAARAADDARLPVPPQEKVGDSLGLIRDAYEEDYQAAKESGEPEQLIAHLRASADQEADPVRKYALLVEAENVAAAHDNYRRAVELLDARATLFRIDGLALKGDLLKRLAGPKVTADLELCDEAMETAREAMRSERFDLATDAASLAVSIAKAIDREQKAAVRKQRRADGRNVVAPAPIGVDLMRKATSLKARVTATEKSFELYKAAVESAHNTPDAAEANAVIGSYLCFVQENWKAGLPALAKSNLPDFASLAADELKLAAVPGPIDPQQAFTLAGKWWSSAETKGVSEDRESVIKDHAAGFYAAIVDRLEGVLEKKLATSRLRGRVHSEQSGARASDTPSQVSPTTVADKLQRDTSRLRWVQDDGFRFFQREGDTLVWREHGQDGKPRHVFKHLRETADFVDIVDDGRNIAIRLRSDACEWTTRDKTDAWKFMGHGHWEGSPPPGPPMAQETNANDFKHSLDPIGAIITGYSGMDTAVTVPQSIDGRPVVAIASDAFNGRFAIRSIVLPASVEGIGNAAFAGCSGMESIVMPSRLAAIGFDAFHNCRLLKTISIPSGVHNIVGGAWCFLGCSRLEEFNVDPANTKFTSIQGVLYNKDVTTLIACPAGKGGSLEIPATVTSIAGNAFLGCGKLDKIVIPQTVTEIPENAFRDCPTTQIKRQ